MIDDDGVKEIVFVESLYEQVPVIMAPEAFSKLKQESVAIDWLHSVVTIKPTTGTLVEFSTGVTLVTIGSRQFRTVYSNN
jgi:hypothetical protein